MTVTAETLPREGDILAGKYRVERVLGAGGMGVVVAAYHQGLDTKVAIKFLLPDMLHDREVVARFEREAKAVAKIANEHVARVLDVGALDTGAPYIVMEFLEGEDLAAWLRARGALPVEQAVEFILHACVAVAEAHGAGIVHRDLKPANLFCVRRADGQLSVKVLDFGIAKLVDPRPGADTNVGSVTNVATVMGSPYYMSPEQMQGARNADAQSDIWALGVTLFELLTASVPFDGETSAAIAMKLATQPPPSARERRSQVPPGLDAVITRCLQRDRRDRYADVAELAVALAEFAPPTAHASVDRITGTVRTAALVAASLPPPPKTTVPPPEASGNTRMAVETTIRAESSPTSVTAASSRPARLWAVLLVLLGGVTAAGLLAALATSSGRPAGAGHPAAASSTIGPAAASEAATIPAAGVAVTSWPPSVAPVPAAPSSASGKDELTRRPPQPTRPPQPARAVPSPAASLAPTAPPPPAQGDCNPPYTLDEQGRKHFRLECYQQARP